MILSTQGGAMIGVDCDGDTVQGGSETGCTNEYRYSEQSARMPSHIRREARERYGWKYKRINGRMYDLCKWHAQKYRG